MSNASHTNRSCPHLGLMDDADTSLAFPSIWNNCYRSRPPAAPRLKHQGEFCLGENYRECPVFLNQQTGPLPGHLRAPRNRVTAPENNLGRNLAIAFILIGILFLSAWGIMSGGSFAPLGFGSATPTASLRPAPASTETPLPTRTASPIPSATRMRTATLAAAIGSVTVTSTSTLTPRPTATRTPTHVQSATATLSTSTHQLDMPIGTDHKFAIHRVLYGENLNQYAARYNTSVNAILAVNYNLKSPLWVDALVIIPVGFTDVTGLPLFEAYQVKDADRSVESLAQELGVAAADLKKYNAIGDGESLVVGDWLLIPRPRPAP